jgi:hypothetical protein
MATAEHRHLATADDRAWELFFDALDADSDAAREIPPGAAIVAADSPDREELVRRYHAERRAVVLVGEDGREILRPPLLHRNLVMAGALALLAWAIWRSGDRSIA